jgi:TPR repeat protein
LQLAAEQNFPDALIDLAICYAKGSGVDLNLIESLKLCYQAENSGSTRATQLIKILEEQVSAEEIKKAKSLVTSIDLNTP